MRRITRAECATCAVAVALATTSCGSVSAGASDGQGIIRASWGDPQNPLEPTNVTEVQGGKVLDMIFRGLKKYDQETGEAKNMLAERIETGDSQNFTITIKSGWTFSNGEKVTAHSFVDAWNYGANLRNNQLNAHFFSFIEGYDQVHPESGQPTTNTLSGLKVTSPLTFTVKLSQKFSTWPDTLGYVGFSPLPQAFFDDHEAWISKPIGNGPYRIESFTEGSGMKLRKWADYPGADKAQNGGVDLRVYTDSNTAYTDLIAGNLDLVDDVPASQLENVQADLDDRYINTPAGIIQNLFFPFYDPAWNKPDGEKLRKGISMAIDRQKITDVIFQKTRTPATDWTSPVLGVDGGFKAGLCGDACEYNAAEAKKLINEAGGIPGGQMKITYNADTQSNKEWVEAVCSSVNNVLGNDRACVGNPVGTFAAYRNQIGEHRMPGPFSARWQMDYPLIQNFLQPLYYTNASSNDGQWSNAQFDSLVDEANAESDTAVAVEIFQEAEQVIAGQMAAIPLWYQNGGAAYSDNLSNVSLNPFSVPVYDQIEVND
ncbi:ABC transporter substrate-binding protein [Streptomyces sp. NPDC006984]|uniref:peptide ABC transporter substrate-binding protein n=1 Tax=Streptomyces sp. NPDC006984 TaxID=3155463 RepID=UPI0033D5E9E0